MGSYQARYVQVDDVVRVGDCMGPVACSLAGRHAQLNVVFVCSRHARRHTITVRPSQLVTVVLRAPRGAVA